MTHEMPAGPLPTSAEERVETQPAARSGGLARSPIILGIVAGVILCAALLVFMSWLSATPPQPAATASTVASRWCTALEQQDYASAYQLLASGLRDSGTAAQFTASEQQLDALSGRVTACKAQTPTTETDAAASVPLQITRSKAGVTPDTLHMVNEQGIWHISGF